MRSTNAWAVRLALANCSAVVPFSPARIRELPPTATSAVFDISFLTRRCALSLFALASRSSPDLRVVSRRGGPGARHSKSTKRFSIKIRRRFCRTAKAFFQRYFQHRPGGGEIPLFGFAYRDLSSASRAAFLTSAARGPPPPLLRAWSTSGEQRRAKGEERLFYLTNSNIGSRTASYSGTRVHFISSSMIAFCACSRFSACWNTNERGQSMTSSVTSSPR